VQAALLGRGAVRVGGLVSSSSLPIDPSTTLQAHMIQQAYRYDRLID
jgi:hypothetical protein